MQPTFRAKLMWIAGTAGFAFLLLIVTNSLIARRVDEQVASIRDHYLPRVELAGHLEAQFDKLRRAMQDAVAARDAEALDKAQALKDGFLAQLDAARGVIDPADGAALRSVFEDYHGRAVDVSRRLLGGETGEALVASMALMQGRQARTLELLRKAAAFDRDALASAFTAVQDAQVTAARIRLAVSVGCMALVVLLSLWLSRGLIRSLSRLAAGLERFGRGEFDQPISTAGDAELAALAQGANDMAANLKRLAAERERIDWLKRGSASLAQELRGELEPDEVARRALGVLAAAVEAPAAAFYALQADGKLRAIAGYAPAAGDAAAASPAFALGEGLVGQAATQQELVVVRDPPDGYLRVRSGLGEAAPRAIVLVPLQHLGKPVGVIELASFSPWSESFSELALSVRETVAIALEVAQGRARQRELLAETQRQAQRLIAQEEELRTNNDELQAQQEELRQTNEELEVQQRALEERNRQLDDARDSLERKAAELSAVSAYKSQFLTNMSHELRTPLNSMLLLSNMLAENATGNLTAKQMEFGRTIHSSGKDLLALINQVLDLAKVEAGKQELVIEDVALRPLLEHVERVFEPLARDKGLRLTFDVDAALPAQIATDRQRLEQILRNLLGNAIKFTDRGSVTLRVRCVDDQIELAVRDTGIGIAPEHQARVFAPFEQVDAAADRRHGGTGLGLAIARELALLMGGDLRLHSTVGEGSTFTLTLPRGAAAPTPRPPAEPTPRAQPPARPQPAPNGPPCVLVIEDDRHVSDALVELIAAQGIPYLVADEGRAGLRLAREHRPSGIILDVKLPDIDGWAVMEALRADPATASIPVHFVSALDASARALAMGAIGYLTKPASHDDLLHVVESLAPRRASRPPRVLVTEDDAILGDSLVKHLTDEHLEVERAPTARAALEALGRAHFDCMILDLALPDMDGLELLQKIDQQDGGPRPAVVVYTARALTKGETRRLEAYSEAIVLKDGSSQERLLEEIRLFVRRLKDGLGPRRPSPPPRLAPAALQLKGAKILLADDDMRTVYALSAALIAKGAEVLIAETGQAAVDMMTQHPDIAVVLMDIMMPEMDGYEATRRIRKDPRFATLPIIALTAKAMKGDAERCLEAGASDYMSKPIDAAKLLELIHRRITAPRAS